MAKRSDTVRRGLRVALVVLGLGAVVALAVVGWRWQANLPVRAIDVTGVVHADTAAVLDLAAVPDSSLLFDLDPAILADRVQRHPWVADASVTRWMTGTLTIDVTERVPTALVLGGDGRPAYYFDAAGFQMPAGAPVRAYDVPLLHGVWGDFHPTQPTEDEAIRDLLVVLATAPPAVDAVVSSVERSADGSVRVWTEPSPGGDAIPVTLGRGGYEEKLGRLRAFWDQAILPRPDTPVRRIDLRFDGQIVTEEPSTD